MKSFLSHVASLLVFLFVFKPLASLIKSQGWLATTQALNND